MHTALTSPTLLHIEAGACKNHLLAALPTMTRLALQPHLQPVTLTAGSCLHEAGAVPPHVFFPRTAIVSLVSGMRDGASAEVAVVGAEGLVGLWACMGEAPAHDTAIVQATGQAWRVGLSTLMQQAWRDEALLRPLMRYGQALMLHISQTAACHRLHALEPRLCRWLLAMLDRQRGPEVHVTQDRIAAMLGVRREGVTAAALKLQRAGVIRYGRGQITVLDRGALEDGSCECHAVIRGAYAHGLDEAEAAAPTRVDAPREPAALMV